MNEQDKFNKFKKLFERNELISIGKNIIYQDPAGYYVLFDSYTIEKTENGYKVSKDYVHKQYIFCNARNAIVYATLDRRNKINEARKVLELDRILEDSIVKIEVYKNLSEKAKSLEAKSIHLTKMNESILKKKQINEKLEDYITEVKKWQSQKFKEAAK